MWPPQAAWNVTRACDLQEVYEWNFRVPRMLNQTWLSNPPKLMTRRCGAFPFQLQDEPGAFHAALASHHCFESFVRLGRHSPREKPPHLPAIYNSYVNESMSGNWNMYISGRARAAERVGERCLKDSLSRKSRSSVDKRRQLELRLLRMRYPGARLESGAGNAGVTLRWGSDIQHSG